MLIIPIILSGFAFSIGGERYFGKWRRSLLLVPVFCLKNFIIGGPWWAYVAIAANFYTYQALFYDTAIKMIYPDSGSAPTWSKILGWLLNLLNGALAAIFPFVLYLSMGKVWHSIISLIAGGLGWCFIVFLSNTLKAKIPFCVRIGEVKVLCPEDSWWLACFVFGAIIGVI